MKRETTNEIIANSFRELAARKPVDKITVGEIVSNCNLSAPTFYRHFHDKYDLITWIYGQEVSKYILRSDNPPPGHDEILAAWVDYCMKNSALLTNLMKNTDGYDSFLRNMVKEHVRIVEDDITSRNGPEAITKKTHLMIYTFSCGIVRLMFAWLTGGVSATQEEIFEVINDSFPEPIQRLVTPPPLKKRHNVTNQYHRDMAAQYYNLKIIPYRYKIPVEGDGQDRLQSIPLLGLGQGCAPARGFFIQPPPPRPAFPVSARRGDTPG